MASSRPETILTERIKSEYSVDQSSSVAGTIPSLRQQRDRLGAAADFDARLLELRHHRRQELARNRFVNQQRFGGVANRRTLHLRVVGHGDCFLQVGGAIHVDVADAFAVPENGNAAVLRDEFHQRRASREE